MTDHPRIFVIGGTVSARDPLDLTPSIRHILSDEFDIVEVRPGTEMTVRGVMQNRRPGVDVVLFDFSEPAAAKALIDLPKTLSGIAVLGAEKLRRESTNLRAWQDVAVVSPADWPLATVLALDADIGGQFLHSDYPLSTIGRSSSGLTAGSELDVYVCFGSPEMLYGAVLAWRGFVDKPDQSILALAVATEPEAVRLSSYVEALGATDTIEIRLVSSRIQVVRLCNAASAVLDINPLAWRGKTAPVLAAERAGIPALRVDESQLDVPDIVLNFLNSTLRPVDDRVLAADHEATALQRMTGFRRALRQAVSISQNQSRRDEVAA